MLDLIIRNNDHGYRPCAGTRMFFAPPIDYNRMMKHVPWGKMITVGTLREDFTRINGADFTEPITAAGELNPKYPGGVLAQKAKLEAEGHSIVQKGRKNLRVYVQNDEDVLFDLD